MRSLRVKFGYLRPVFWKVCFDSSAWARILVYYYYHYFTRIHNLVINSWNNCRFVTIHNSFRIFIDRHAGQGRPHCQETCCANTKTSPILHFQIFHCLHCYIKPIIQCHIGVISNWHAFIFEKSTFLDLTYLYFKKTTHLQYGMNFFSWGQQEENWFDKLHQKNDLTLSYKWYNLYRIS